MIHLNTISWAQIILIQAGVIFQIIALRAIFKGPSGYQGNLSMKQDAAESDQESEPVSKGAAMDRKLSRHKVNTQALAARIGRTSKVAFKQSFKFREQSPLAHHNIEH